MAFYAELRRRKWYCVNQFNAIRWYSIYLYDEWYKSLTEEEKQKLEEYKRKKKEKEAQEARESLKRLAMLTGMIVGMANKNNQKYNGVYDELGFPNTQYLEGKNEEK